MTELAKLVQVGRVGKPHGVRGEVKVIPEADDPQQLEKIDTFYVGASPEAALSLQVTGFRYQHSSKGLTLLVKFAGYDTPEEVEELRRQAVFVLSEALPVDDDEMFAADLLGFDVVTVAGDRVGTLTEVLDMPAQLVYQVTRTDGGISLVPAVEEFVRSIDEDARLITVSPIEGLFE